MPFNTSGLPNANALAAPSDSLFLAGDIRANENIELTSIQTLFVREHNFQAALLKKQHPTWTDEQLYQGARAIVIAEIQSITYNEYIPALMGTRALATYRGYNPSVNPGISPEFSDAAFRFGHSQLNDDVISMSNDGVALDTTELADDFFNPAKVQQDGIDGFLKYLASDPAQAVDTQAVDDVRNELFGPPGAGGADLIAIDIARGHDTGIGTLNQVRAAYGLTPYTSFAQVTSDAALQAQLQSLYGDVNKLDLFVGGLAENHVPGSSLGSTFQAVLADQFTRLRDGDRFWFENVFSGPQLKMLENTTLASIIARNSTTTNLQGDVFFFHTAITGQVFADMNSDGQLNRLEPGLPGLTVQLLDATGDVIATALTGRDGRYSFDGLDLGSYQVQVAIPVSVGQPSSTVQAVDLTRSMTISGLDFAVRVKTLAKPPIGHPHSPSGAQGPLSDGHWSSGSKSTFSQRRP